MLHGLPASDGEDRRLASFQRFCTLGYVAAFTSTMMRPFATSDSCGHAAII
jgi:hypothetical protein